jgi:probable rRNA maturation factor
MTHAGRQALKIDVRVDSDIWNATKNVKALVRQAISRARATLSAANAELAVILTDDPAIRRLNRQWRGIDTATNVLSFPTKHAIGNPPLIGDIVLAYETVAREARTQRKPFTHHVAHLVVHGYLHLVGYDHESPKEAEEMEAIERKILQRLAIPDPYRRSAKPGGLSRKES